MPQRDYRQRTAKVLLYYWISPQTAVSTNLARISPLPAIPAITSFAPHQALKLPAHNSYAKISIAWNGLPKYKYRTAVLCNQIRILHTLKRPVVCTFPIAAQPADALNVLAAALYNRVRALLETHKATSIELIPGIRHPAHLGFPMVDLPHQNIVRFLESITGELQSQANRVRNLIGERHWPTDGMHKEALLRNLLAQYLPANILLRKGFNIDPTDFTNISNEQDIIVLNASVATPIFSTDDFCVVFPESIIATISVKTKPTRTSVRDTVQNLYSVRRVCRNSPNAASIWCGAFFFEDQSRHRPVSNHPFTSLRNIASCLPNPAPAVHGPSLPLPLPDVLSTISDVVCEVRWDSAEISPAMNLACSFRSCPGLAAAIFLTLLLDHISDVTSARITSLATLWRKSTPLCFHEYTIPWPS